MTTFFTACGTASLAAATRLLPTVDLLCLWVTFAAEGQYYSIIRDVLTMEPDLGQLRSVIIKAQHNCWSDRKSYASLEDVPIKHEYCAVFKNTNSVPAIRCHSTHLLHRQLNNCSVLEFRSMLTAESLASLFRDG